MCGRITLYPSDEDLMRFFGVEGPEERKPRYNVAPTQKVAIVRCEPDESVRQLDMVRWGLVPSWAKELKIGARMINARAETAATKPSFRSAWRKRRCTVVASGFYEWLRRDGQKKPFYIHRTDEAPLAIAGLWENWRSPEGEWIRTATILTQAANAWMEPLHHRMPVLLTDDRIGPWLDRGITDREDVRALIDPDPEVELVRYGVSTLVNSYRNDVPDCIVADDGP